MNQEQTIDPKLFVETVREPLERHNSAALARCLHELWTDEQVIELLDCDDVDARKLAALALGMIGGRRCITPLARCLKDADPMVNQMAEHALWTLWFRCGSQEAQEHMQRGSSLLNLHRHDEAIEAFTAAIALDPTYAEAFNQRSITYYLMEDYHSAIDDAAKVVQFMPLHFGAWSGMGHCYAHLGQTKRAIHSYRRAIGINPYLNCCRQILQEIQAGQCSCDAREAHLG